jgi:hypothetical protein
MTANTKPKENISAFSVILSIAVYYYLYSSVL